MSAPVVLVTGAAGFIGGWVLRELLERGCTPVAFDLVPAGPHWPALLGDAADRVRAEVGDALDPTALEAVIDRHGVTHVIHLAGWLTPACHRDPCGGARANVLAPMRLFEAARARSGRLRSIVYASSVAVYGCDAEDPGLPNDRPATFYGAFKRAAEDIARQYWLHHGVASVGLRPFVVYGPGREHGLTAAPSLAARAVAEGRRYAIGFSGRTGFEFVADTAVAFARCALEVASGCHAADLPGVTASVDDLVAELVRLRPHARGLLTIDGPPLPYPTTLTGEPIARLLPEWRTTSLADGLRRTLEHHEAAARQPA